MRGLIENGWHIVRFGHEMEDMPEIAGCEYIVSVENRYGQLSTTLAFTGYGDFKWYTNVDRYKQQAKSGDNRLSDAFRVLAWMSKPEPYNPYMQDIRYVTAAVKRQIKKQKGGRISGEEALNLITDGFFHEKGTTVEKHDQFARGFWKEETSYGGLGN